MNISGASGMMQTQSSFPSQRPSAEDLAAKMISALESGSIDTDTLTSNLEDRFGEDATSIVSQDGSIDAEALTEYLSNVESTGESQRPPEGGMPPPPPPPSENTASLEDFQTLLAEQFGTDAAAAAFNEDGSANFDELVSLIQSSTSGDYYSSNTQTTGNLLNVMA